MPQFLWSSLHCLEKYAKCIAVLNRINATSVSHAVRPTLTIIAAQGKFPVWISDETAQFLEHLEGMAEYRYFQVSYYDLGEDLTYLDRAVWEIRRYCQPLDFSMLASAEHLPSLTSELNRIELARSSGEKGTCIQGGWLERILDNRYHPARAQLVWNNLHFGSSRRRQVRLRTYSEGANAPLFLHPEIVDEVVKYVRLEKPIADMWRAEASARRKE